MKVEAGQSEELTYDLFGLLGHAVALPVELFAVLLHEFDVEIELFCGLVDVVLQSSHDGDEVG